MRLLCEPSPERASSFQREFEVVHTKEQEESVARCCVIRTHQGGMLVSAPLVETEQDSSVRVNELTKVCVGWRRLRLAEE